MKYLIVQKTDSSEYPWRAAVIGPPPENPNKNYVLALYEGSFEDAVRGALSEHPDCNTLQMEDGSFESPDCLTLLEAAEVYYKL